MDKIIKKLDKFVASGKLNDYILIYDNGERWGIVQSDDPLFTCWAARAMDQVADEAVILKDME